MARSILTSIFALTSTAVARPTIGFNLWDPMPHAEDPRRLVREIEAMRAGGFRRVVLIPFVYADRTTGHVRADWPGDRFSTMTDAELAAAGTRAKALGMTVGVTPFVEPRNRAVGRDELAFTPATEAGRAFWADYRQQVVRLAQVAKAARVDEFDVGSELVGMDHDRANAAEWKKLIAAAADAFGGGVGYTTQHWTFDQPATVEMIWRDSRINVVSLSAYLDYQPEYGHAGLAAPADCRGAASDSPQFVETVKRNFTAFVVNRINPVAKAVGKPVRVGEFGLPPYDTAATVPYRWQWPAGTPYDPTEAANTWHGVLAACAAFPDVRSIDAWVWGWPGGFPGERFYLRPAAVDDTPGDGFDEGQTRAVMGVLEGAAQ